MRDRTRGRALGLQEFHTLPVSSGTWCRSFQSRAVISNGRPFIRKAPSFHSSPIKGGCIPIEPREQGRERTRVPVALTGCLEGRQLRYPSRGIRVSGSGVAETRGITSQKQAGGCSRGALEFNSMACGRPKYDFQVERENEPREGSPNREGAQVINIDPFTKER